MKTHKNIIAMLICLIIMFCPIITGCFPSVGTGESGAQAPPQFVPENAIPMPNTNGSNKIDDMFYGVKIVTDGGQNALFNAKTNPADKLNGNTFDDVIKSYIDVLSQDILTRLANAYGYHSLPSADISLKLPDIESGAYPYEGNDGSSFDEFLNESYKMKDVLAVSIDGTNYVGQTPKTPSIDSISDYAYILNTQWYYSSVHPLTNFSHTYAINGGYNYSNYKIEEDDTILLDVWEFENVSENDKSDIVETQYKDPNKTIWKYNLVDNIADVTDFVAAYVSAHIEKLRVAIANILATGTVFVLPNGNLDDAKNLSFDAAVSLIDHTGFLNFVEKNDSDEDINKFDYDVLKDLNLEKAEAGYNERQRIMKFVYDVVIGKAVMSYDNGLYNGLLSVLPNQPGSSFTLANQEINSGTKDFLDGDENYRELHYYKAYSLIVPELISNCFNLNQYGTYGEVKVDQANEAENGRLPAADGTGTVLSSIYEIQPRAKSNDMKFSEMSKEEGAQPGTGSDTEFNPDDLEDLDVDEDVDLDNLTSNPPIVYKTEETSFKTIIFKPIAGSAALELVFSLETDPLKALELDIQFSFTYVVNGQKLLDNQVIGSSMNTTNTDNKIFTIMGESEYPELPQDGSLPDFSTVKDYTFSFSLYETIWANIEAEGLTEAQMIQKYGSADLGEIMTFGDYNADYARIMNMSDEELLQEFNTTNKQEILASMQDYIVQANENGVGSAVTLNNMDNYIAVNIQVLAARQYFGTTIQPYLEIPRFYLGILDPIY